MGSIYVQHNHALMPSEITRAHYLRDPHTRRVRVAELLEFPASWERARPSDYDD